jgi:two-component system sensor histidine kinase BaeS
MQNLMVSSVAHELRTPLTNIRGYLEALAVEVLAPSGELFLSLHEETRTNLTAVVERAIGICRPKIEAKQLSLDFRPVPAVHEITADADRIVRGIRNLLQNAVEHAAPGGHIQVILSESNDAIRLLVADDGESIDDANLPFIFDRFYRGRRPAEQARGAGLELAIVKEPVIAHGGRVGADRSDTGARVWFTVPKQPRLSQGGGA